VEPLAKAAVEFSVLQEQAERRRGDHVQLVKCMGEYGREGQGLIKHVGTTHGVYYAWAHRCKEC